MTRSIPGALAAAAVLFAACAVQAQPADPGVAKLSARLNGAW